VILFTILATAGLVLSLYAAYVTFRLHRNKQHQPLCNISKKISCSVAFTSHYRHLLGIPNVVLGILYFGTLIAFASSIPPALLVFLTATALCISMALTYIAIYRLHNICVVCFTIHAINLLLFLRTLAVYT